MLVGNHRIPESLASLLRRGLWGTAHDPERARELLGIPPGGSGDFLGTRARIASELAGAKGMVVQQRDITIRAYGMDSSRLSGGPVALPLLDVERGLPIYVTWDEDQVWLDYRAGAEPRVVRTLRVGAHAEWRVLTPTFDDLARRLGIPL